jgi:hypothetical protein
MLPFESDANIQRISNWTNKFEKKLKKSRKSALSRRQCVFLPIDKQ